MAAVLTPTVHIVMHALTAGVCVMAMFSHCYNMAAVSDSMGPDTWTMMPCAPEDQCNVIAYIQLISLVMVFFFIVLTALEVGCVFQSRPGEHHAFFSVFERFQGMAVRPFLYLGAGVMTFGTSGDLGIAGGSLLVLATFFWLTIGLVRLITEAPRAA